METMLVRGELVMMVNEVHDLPVNLSRSRIFTEMLVKLMGR